MKRTKIRQRFIADEKGSIREEEKEGKPIFTVEDVPEELFRKD